MVEYLVVVAQSAGIEFPTRIALYLATAYVVLATDRIFVTVLSENLVVQRQVDPVLLCFLFDFRKFQGAHII